MSPASAPAGAVARVAVIGGGITGLAAAWELTERRIVPVVFESDVAFGGKIRTTPFAGLTAVDEGADAFLARVPFGTALAGQVGLGDTLVSPATGTAFVSHGGRAHPIPTGLVLGVPKGLGGLVRSRLLSPRGVARAALDLVLPRRSTDHDSVGQLVRDRFGAQVLELLVDPLVGSINAGDADQLSLRASTPQIADATDRCRSLLLGLRRTPPPADGPVFLAPLGGMGSLVDALVAQLTARGAELRLGTNITSLAPEPGGTVTVDGEEFDAVIITTPTFAAGALVEGFAPTAAELLHGIPNAGVVMATLALPLGQIPSSLAGSGYLVPKPEQDHVTAASFASRKWAHWRPDGHEVLRVSLGRFGNQVPMDFDDERIVDTAVAELRRHLGLTATPTPDAVRITRWPRGFPQYLPHHLERVTAIERHLAEAAPTVRVAGAGLGGLGVPACIRQGRQAAAATALRLVGPPN
jgi:protoporphyrinogen/coproporphyrinogen III oxidase